MLPPKESLIVTCAVKAWVLFRILTTHEVISSGTGRVVELSTGTRLILAQERLPILGLPDPLHVDLPHGFESSRAPLRTDFNPAIDHVRSSTKAKMKRRTSKKTLRLQLKSYVVVVVFIVVVFLICSSPFVPLRFRFLRESSIRLTCDIFEEPIFECLFQRLEIDGLPNSFLINVHRYTSRRILENFPRKTARKYLGYQSKG